MPTSFSFARNRFSAASRFWRLAVLLTFGLLGATVPAVVQAAGQQNSLTGNDLQVTIDTRWIGALEGGYYPIRCLIDNDGGQRTVTFAVKPGSRFDDMLPTVRRTITLEAGARGEFLTLSVPIIGKGHPSGQFTVTEDGQEIESLTFPFTLEVPPNADLERPALLAVTDGQYDLTAFETAVSHALMEQQRASGPSYGYASILNHETVPPDTLPQRWIDYSGIDLLATTRDVFENRLDDQRRTAILAWVETGGTLILSEAGTNPENDADLTRLLELSGDGTDSATDPDWQPVNPALRRTLPTNAEMMNNTNDPHMSRRRRPDVPFIENPALANDFEHPAEPTVYQYHRSMLGHIVVTPYDLFAGNYNDWGYLLANLRFEDLQWTQRHGMSGRDSNKEFTEFLNPSVKGTPRYSFLVLITLFTIIIGPLNYLILWKRKKLNLLLVSIPLVAISTSLLLFGYSLFAYGFSVKTRTRSVTYLDQSSGTAVSQARVAMYAGIVPSDGLEFSTDTAVYPVWPPARGFETGTVDWTDRQRWTDGLLPSRTRTQFVLVNHRRERSRLEIGPSGGSAVSVRNGFPVGFRYLLVIDDDGKLFFGKDLAADREVALERANPRAYREVREFLLDQKPEVPADLVGARQGEFSFGPRRYDEGDYTDTEFDNGQLEQAFELVEQAITNAEQLGRRTYIAIGTENPGIDLGLEEPTASHDVHLVIGQY